MTLANRTIFTLMLVLTLAGKLIAQAPSTAAPTDPAASTAPATSPAAKTPTEKTEDPSTGRHYKVREQFMRLLQQHPDELWMILKLDPSLLTNDAFMSGYPEVREFVAGHPEILKNPRFFLAPFNSRSGACSTTSSRCWQSAAASA